MTETIDTLPISTPAVQVADVVRTKLESARVRRCCVEKTDTQWVITCQVSLPT